MSYSCLTGQRWNPFIGLCLHESMVPIPAPPFFMPMTYWPHIDFGIAVGTHLMSFWTEQKKAEIKLDGIHFLGRGSDAMPVIPHVDLLLGYNTLLPWTIIFGSSITVWGTGDVTIATKNPLFGDTACDLACSPFKNAYCTLNLVCNNPVSFVLDVTFVWGTAKVGFTMADFLACLIDIAIEIAMDILMKFGGKLAGKAASKVWKGLKKGATAAEAGMKKAYKKITAEAVDEATEKAVAQATADVVSEAIENAALKAAKNAAAEAAEAAATKAAKEAAEEASEAVASKTAKEVREAMEAALDSMRKQADEIAEEVTEEVTETAFEKFQRISLDVWDDVLLYADDAITSFKTWKKSVQNYLLKCDNAFASLLYSDLAKNAKFMRKIFQRSYGAVDAQFHDVGDMDMSSDQYTFLLWTLGDRSDVYDEETIADVTEADEADRFDWADEQSPTAMTKVASRFLWAEAIEDGRAASTEVTPADRFAWVEDEEELAT